MSAQKKYFAEIPDGELKDILKSQFRPLFKLDYMEVEGCCMPVNYKKLANEILNFEVKDNDVYVCSFAKCGTTWTQEMVWCIANDLDFETAKKVVLEQRFPFMEISGILPEIILQNFECKKNSLQYIQNLQGQRFVKTHLPFQLLPRQLQSEECKAKIVYVARDVRDVCVSYYHHYSALHGFTGNFDTFFKLFINNKVTHAPYWMNVLGFWNIRNRPNVLFITYEDMKKDLPAVIRRVASFLDKTLTPQQVATLAEHLSFQNMKNNAAVNKEIVTNTVVGGDFHFMREGKSGGYVKEMTTSQIEALNEWSMKNVQNTDYMFT